MLVEDAILPQEPGHQEPSEFPRSLLSPQVGRQHYRILRISDDGSRHVLIEGLYLDIAQALKRALDNARRTGNIRIDPDFGDLADE
jgi:hypothetical protein